MAETNYERAKRRTIRQYFTYSESGYYRSAYRKISSLEEVICHTHKYVPRTDSADPLKAYKAHLKKYDRSIWEEKFGKPFVIHELDDLELERFGVFV